MTIHTKMSALLGEAKPPMDPKEVEDILNTAGDLLDTAMSDLEAQKKNIEEDIEMLREAWDEWDVEFLVDNRYISREFAKDLKAAMEAAPA